jgi:uncharacterized protein (TIGR02757 family)
VHQVNPYAHQFSDLKEYLDAIVNRVNNLDFIALDPISIPHRFKSTQDIEIAGFFSAILAWGNRKTIISKALELMSLFDNQPFDFIVNHQENDLKPLMSFKHRTFQATDLLYFIHFFKLYYQENKSLETAFRPQTTSSYNQKDALSNFHNLVFNNEYAPQRSRKHIATPAKNSTCKRLNMFLRWMVRNDDKKVDFGIWQTIPMSELMIPIDVHVEKYARQFGLLTRKQRDWIAVEEITANLKRMNPQDPVIYDYALFGLGVGFDN